MNIKWSKVRSIHSSKASQHFLQEDRLVLAPNAGLYIREPPSQTMASVRGTGSHKDHSQAHSGYWGL